MSAILVRQIDFLPDKFRHAVRRRRASYWRVLVVFMFAGVFVAAACGLQAVRNDVRREYQQTVDRYTAAQAQETLLKNRELRLAELRAYADLVTFLRHPWPRSQVLDQLFAPLPATVIIDKLHLGNELRPVVAGEAAAPPSEAAGDPAAAKSPATDLAELRKLVEAGDVVIHLEGTTVDQPQLHAYLHHLKSGRLFLRAEVESIEAARTEGAVPAVGSTAGASRFMARIVVRRGWGLADGPSAEELTVVSQAAPGDEP